MTKNPVKRVVGSRHSRDDHPKRGNRRSRPAGRAECADRRPRGRKKPRRRGILRGLFYWGTVAGIWAAIAVFGFAVYVVFSLPDAASFALPKREPGLTVLDAEGVVIARRGAFHGDTVRLDELPRYLPQAVIATEDRRFYQHFGIDPSGLARAIAANLRARRIVQGGSTITQQLAKNLFLKPERTLRRKVQEAVLAVWLESLYSKDEILQLYLNRVYLGAGSYGVDAAAQRYFGKSARSVTLSEAAVLAGLLKAPSRYAPTRNPRKAELRAQQVLASMVEAGFISRQRGQFAVDNPAAVARGQSVASGQYVVDWVADLVPGFVNRPGTGLIVETTVNSRLQAMAEKAVIFAMTGNGDSNNAGQAALVAMDGTGAVRALVGGRSYAGSQFNRAVQARRQPGSAFKPFVFLTAVNRGLSADDIRNDAPVTIGKWRPRNYSGKYLGPITLRTALAKSANAVSARLTAEFGARAVVETASRLGISSPLKANPSISLGTSEVSLLELTRAYVPFANGGYGVVPHIINIIRTDKGKILYRRQGQPLGRVVSQRSLREMNDMMTATIVSGTGRNARLPGHPAAGKTGTSQGFRDAWFVGYTARMTAGVWVGNDDGTPMSNVTGGGLPAIIWRNFMTEAHRALAPKPLPGIAAQPIAGIASLLRAIGIGDDAASPGAPGADRDDSDAIGRRLMNER